MGTGCLKLKPDFVFALHKGVRRVGFVLKDEWVCGCCEEVFFKGRECRNRTIPCPVCRKRVILKYDKK